MVVEPISSHLPIQNVSSETLQLTAGTKIKDRYIDYLYLTMRLHTCVYISGQNQPPTSICRILNFNKIFRMFQSSIWGGELEEFLLRLVSEQRVVSL